MRKFKSSITRNKKICAALVAFVSLGLSYPAYASEVITVEGGTEDNINEGENPAGNTIDEVKTYSGMLPTILNFYSFGANPSNNGYVKLTNNGVIDLKYSSGLVNFDPSIYTMAAMGRGVIAGANSTLINNGTVKMNFDEGDNVTVPLYFHGMTVSGDYSSLLNNGNVIIYGLGSSTAEIRGTSTSGKHSLITNKGTYLVAS